MYERVMAYILQHSREGASDPFASVEAENLVGNDRNTTTTTRPPLAPLDENANPQKRRRPRLMNSKRLTRAVLNGSDHELVESIVGFVQQDVVEIDENERETTTETAATSLVTTQK